MTKFLTTSSADCKIQIYVTENGQASNCRMSPKQQGNDKGKELNYGEVYMERIRETLVG
jgi:hypothetical protein